jgi:polysaccharide export outer membrane protein
MKRVVILVLALSVYFFTPLRADEYRLQPGDVVEIGIANYAELKQRLPIQMDGSLSLPLVGTLPAQGLTLTELRLSVQGAFEARVWRVRLPDGREETRFFERDGISVSIIEYRPVFVAGDVGKPGEIVYRPSMTVRQAIASAGGAPGQAMRGLLAPFDPANAKNEYINAWINMFAGLTQIWRIENELGQERELDQTVLANAPVSQSVLNQMVETETQLRERRSGEYAAQRSFYERAVEQANTQVNVLTEQQKKEDEGMQEDIADFQRVNDLYGKGSLTSQRVTDARRNVLLSSTRKLQTEAQLLDTIRKRGEYQRELERLDHARRSELLKDLKDAQLKLAGDKARLEGAQEKLAISGMRLPGSSGLIVKVMLHRQGPEKAESFEAQAETVLVPGDALDVTVQGSRYELGAAAQR